MLINTIRCSVIAVVVFFFAVMAVGVSSAGNNGPEEIVLKSADAKKPARFPHKRHQALFKCEECHHTQSTAGKKGPYVEGQEKKCESCHNKEFHKDLHNLDGLNSLHEVCHALCKGCHRRVEREGKRAPIKCAGCHIM